MDGDYIPLHIFILFFRGKKMFLFPTLASTQSSARWTVRRGRESSLKDGRRRRYTATCWGYTILPSIPTPMAVSGLARL